jgi:hypothetical protein
MIGGWNKTNPALAAEEEISAQILNPAQEDCEFTTQQRFLIAQIVKIPGNEWLTGF